MRFVVNIVISILSFILVLSGLKCSAQYFEDSENVFQKLTVENGLSQNTIHCIFRDKIGFVWFGTRSGLNRFDGKNITIFEKELGNGSNLKDIQIFHISEDDDGIIWIGTENGIVKYDYEQESLDHVSLARGAEREPFVFCMEPEADSLFWLGTNDGLRLFNKKNSQIIKEYRNEPYQPHSISSNRVTSICNNGNEVLVGTLIGLNVFDKQKMLFKRYYDDEEDPYSLVSDNIKKILRDTAGNIWIGTEGGGISFFDKKHDNFITYNTLNSKIPHDDIRDIFEIGDGNLWIATNGGGLTLFDSNDRSFRNYSYNSKNLNGISNNSIYSVLVDYEGILWLGSYAGGINFNTTKISDFKTITHQPSNSNSICESNARSLNLSKDGKLLIGTFGGLSIYDPESKIFNSYLSDPNDEKSLSFNKVIAVFEDDKKNTWVGTYSGGLNLLKNGRKGFLHYLYESSTNKRISSNIIFCVIQDSIGNLWSGTSRGLDKYDEKEDRWVRRASPYTRDLCLGANNKIFLAVGSGIAEYDIDSTSIEYYTLSNNGVPTVVLYNDSNEKIWYGTHGDGLGCFDIKTKSSVTYTTTDGLPSNFVSSIVGYDEKYLWLSTFKGISLFNKETKAFKNFGMADGISFLEFHPRSAIVLPDNTIAFGGTNGIVCFDPKKVIHGEYNSKILFNTLRIDGKEVEVGAKNSPLSKNINLMDEIILEYDQNDFSFEFNDINFKSRQQGNYAFLLENYMKEWSFIGDQNMVSFTNMSPGDYVLRVKEGGTLNSNTENEATIGIRIIPPFWMRWYFFLLIFLAFVGLMYLYSKYTLISINQKNRIKLENLEYEKHEEFNKLRLRFFTYISHELRTPLTLILDPLKKIMKIDIDDENRNYLALVEKNTNRLHKLVNQILDFRKLENDALKLNVKRENIAEIVTEIYSSFSEVANSKKINYRFDNQLKNSFFGWIDSDKLEKIIYNLLSNAFKFTKENGEVVVRLIPQNNNESILIVVEDTGIGIKPENLQHIFDLFYTSEKNIQNFQGGVGIGLTYVKRLVDLHHGTIAVESVPEEGTSFSIELPVNKTIYDQDEVYALENQESTIDIEPRLEEHLGSNNLKTHKHNGDVPLIVIVEDETDLRKYLSHRLSKKFRVIEAENGRVALTLIRNKKPELILSDNIMPEMDGIDLCNELKQSDDTGNIPFVFLSAWSSNDFKLRGLKLGADDYITKPFDYDILEAKLHNIINNRRKFIEIADKMVKVEPSDVQIETSDEKFIFRAQEIIEKNIDNPDFSTKEFEEQIFMSHSVIYRKLKRITGLSANRYIREYRIRRAAQILAQDSNLTVAEVSLLVGFKDAKYFSQCFKKLLGVLPSEYITQEDE